MVRLVEITMVATGEPIPTPAFSPNSTEWDGYKITPPGAVISNGPLATYSYPILMVPEDNAVCAPSRGSRASLPTHQNGYSLLYVNIDAFSRAPRLVSVSAVHRLPSDAG